MFDCAIIGTGPAGISAALTLKIRNKSIIWFGNKELSIKVNKAEKIKNYPGLINVSGKEMEEVFSKQIEDMGLEITEKTVTGIYQMGDYYSILCNQEMFDAKTIILCTGVSSLKSVPGETELLGQGVSYCATCDGFLYKGKEIAVVIQDESYLGEVDYLADLASKVYLIPLYNNAKATKENIVILNDKIVSLSKESKKINVAFKENSISVDGIFFLKSAVAPDILLPGLEVNNGHVVTNKMCETNMPGVFAAGDITGVPYQYTKAVGEGNVAAFGVNKYLTK